MSGTATLVLDAEQVRDVLAALGEECAMDRIARRSHPESTVALFRRLVTRAGGVPLFKFRPQKLAGRVQIVVLRPDLTLQVWETKQPSRQREDFETTIALEPVRERLDTLARSWGLRESAPFALKPLLATPRERLSALASRSDH